MGRGRGTAANAGLNEFQLRDLIKKGNDASERQKVLEGYFKTLEDNIISKWKQTHSIDKDAREELWRQYHTLSEIKRAIEQEIIHGKQALKKLEDSK